jgi:hypothetical protein
MSDYLRTTRECPFEQLKSELRQPLETSFQENELGTIQLCVETLSEPKELGWLASLLGDHATGPVHLAVVLTESHLVWARYSAATGTNVIAADLRFIRVKPFTSFFNRDQGLEISGVVGDVKGSGKGGVQGYLGLGPEPATTKLIEAVQAAILVLNPDSGRKWPAWMGK